jgi:recombinational DNA repair protein (RecF pathway)
MGEEHVPDPDLYDLVSTALRGVSEGRPDAVLKFKTGLLDHLGIFPSLTGCARCGRSRVKGNVHLDTSGHGFLCSDCAGDLNIHHPIPMRVLHLLHAFRNEAYLLETADADLVDKADEVVTELLQAFLQAGLKTASAAHHARLAERKHENHHPRSEDNNSGAVSG